jgi:predicted Zn-dependent peptidase
MTLAACGSSPAPSPVPPPTTAAVRPLAPLASPASGGKEQPPPPLAAKPSPFPAVAKRSLQNGLRVSVVESHALPVIEVRVVVHAGMGFGPPAVGEITATMLEEGGTRAHTATQVIRRIETLGSSLRVSVGRDATELSMGVVRGQLDQALDILGEVLRTPRFDGAELARVKARMSDEARDDARSSGTWSANRILFQTLYPAVSPYAVSEPVSAEIAKVDDAAVRGFYRRLYVPSNIEIIVAGDVETQPVSTSIDRVFGDWKAVAAPASTAVEFPEPEAPGATRVVVASRPHSVQSDIVVTQLLPELHSPTWPADRVALHVLGGGLTGRLFEYVREKESLAYSASARPVELAHDAQPLFAYAGTQAPKTAEAVQAMLDTLSGMRSSPPREQEVAEAKRYLSGIFAVRMETIGAISDMVAQLRELNLPDDYWDTYRAALRGVTTADVDAAAARMFAPGHLLIVVAGDADVVAAPLARFGDVTVVDPEHDFHVVRTIPKAAAEADRRGN